MSEPLPARANFDYLKKLCKQRVKERRAAGKSVKLAAVQREIARRYGFKSWTKLREHVQSQSAPPTNINEFLEAVGEGDLATVRKMLAANPALANAIGKHPTWGGTPQPLHVAIERDRRGIFDALLRAGANPSGNNEGYDLWSPLMLALHWKRDAMGDALIKAGATQGLIESLMLADDAAVERHLRNPRTLKQKSPNDGTPLHFALTPRAVQLLLDAGIDPAIKDKYGKTALEAAAAKGDAARQVVDLLRTRTSIDADALAPLGDLEGLKVLLQNDPSALTKIKGQIPAGVRALHAAAEHDQAEVIRWLLAQGVPVNATIERAITPLHTAAWAGKLAAAKTLIENGADPAARDQEHSTTPEVWATTALQMFGRQPSGEVARYLASLNAPTAGGKNANDAALDPLIWPANLGTRDTSDVRPTLRQNPRLASTSIYAAAALGSPAALRAHLKENPALAQQPGGIRNWSPLLYLCFSRLLVIEKSKPRRKQFAQCAKLLLDAGADPNSSFINPGDNVPESALYGVSGIANDPALTRLLLQHGANVNDNETLYHTAEHFDHACLKLILAKKPDLLSFCMCHKMDQEDPRGVQVFLDFGADPNFIITTAGEIQGIRPLHFAILRNRSVATIRVLLKNGADPTLKSTAGITPWALAMRLGRKKIAALLHSKTDEQLTPRETFFAACAAGDGKTARKLLKQIPDAVKEMSDHEAALLPRAADEGHYAAVKLMLDLGFPIEARGGWGGTALHHAAWCGHPKIVQLLLDRNARIDLRQHFGGDALHTAIHGSMHGNHNHGPQIVKLIAARITSPDWENYLKQAKAQNAKLIIPVLEALLHATGHRPA